MSNVVLLFSHEGRGASLDPALKVDQTVLQVMSCSATLEDRLRDLCTHLDAVNQLIDQMDDVPLQRSLRQQTRTSRQALVEAKRQLWAELRDLQLLPGSIADGSTGKQSG